jgi:hypothetical protein
MLAPAKGFVNRETAQNFWNFVSQTVGEKFFSLYHKLIQLFSFTCGIMLWIEMPCSTDNETLDRRTSI